jgi:hypothetical protein
MDSQENEAGRPTPEFAGWIAAVNGAISARLGR